MELNFTPKLKNPKTQLLPKISNYHKGNVKKKLNQQGNFVSKHEGWGKVLLNSWGYSAIKVIIHGVNCNYPKNKDRKPSLY